MNIKRVMVAGSGVLGSQIAFQSAYSGFEVNVYDVSDEVIEKSKDRYKLLKINYISDLGASQTQVDEAFKRITFFSEIKKAVKDIDLVIEAVPEVIEIKKSFYEELSKYASEETIFASNSSTMIPSQIVNFTDRPQKYLHLHFANRIWTNNTAEIMKHESTDNEVFETVIEFAKEIGMIALPIYKEQPGYILNSLLVPFLSAAQKLLVNEVADPETIDKTWMAALGVSRGPFATLDIIGINTPYNLALERGKAGSTEDAKVAEFLKKEFIDKGKFGIQSGEGFYSYPEPTFEQADFLS